MGLDMYLMRANREEANGWDNLNCKEQRKTVNPWTEVCYWRKANQIRQWFVVNCDYPEGGDCEEVEITKEKLQELVDTCRRVLDNNELAEELLPRSSGFFFGSQDYDEWYFEDISNTYLTCQKILDTTDWDNEVIVYTDWW